MNFVHIGWIEVRGGGEKNILSEEGRGTKMSEREGGSKSFI